VNPPEAIAEFVAHMEDVLDVYSRPYDPDVPVLCMDEQPVQLNEEVKVPIPATRYHPKHVDYEYQRAGVLSTTRSIRSEPARFSQPNRIPQHPQTRQLA
jgi:hypothetical protein